MCPEEERGQRTSTTEAVPTPLQIIKKALTFFSNKNELQNHVTFFKNINITTKVLLDSATYIYGAM